MCFLKLKSRVMRSVIVVYGSSVVPEAECDSDE